MSFLECALDLSKMGFHVFPLIPNSKKPLIKNFPELATQDQGQIKKWWYVGGKEQPFNIGISTSAFRENQALICLDIDVKNGKNGFETLEKLKAQGYEFPETFKQKTPTGGEHFIYYYAHSVKQGQSVLGEGIDVRSQGGYLVGGGSEINGKRYIIVPNAFWECPIRVVNECGLPLERKLDQVSPTNIDLHYALHRAKKYLLCEAPISIEGRGGDTTAFQVAAYVKDLGVPLDLCFELMLRFWNSRCLPDWPKPMLKDKIYNAYTYGKNPIGILAPEFTSIDVPTEKSPIEKLNDEYALVTAGHNSHILWQTQGPKGEDRTEHLSLASFQLKLAPKKIFTNGRERALSDVWIHSDKRREYKGICFEPGQKGPKDYYNLWRGFSVIAANEVSPKHPEYKSFMLFLDHIRENICQSNAEHYDWVMTYFAQMIQKPWNKPGVAIVLRGEKGVGKNFFIERMGQLIRNHFLLTSNRRYLVSNFNSHLEKLILFALDEAFWSGDKQAEGVLKDLITGESHEIERKGHEPYEVSNCTRIAILGNEEWLVPATEGERRFAVFDVGNSKQQDHVFFQSIAAGMERGGYGLLLRHLLDYDISKINLRNIPKSKALLDQKMSSLPLFFKWISESLIEGHLLYTDIGGDWVIDVPKEKLRDGYSRWISYHNYKAKIPIASVTGKWLKQCFPSLETPRLKEDDGTHKRVYRFPDLETCRREWSMFIGHDVDFDSGD